MPFRFQRQEVIELRHNTYRFHKIYSSKQKQHTGHYQAGISGTIGIAVTGTGEFFKTFSVTDPKRNFPFSP